MLFINLTYSIYAFQVTYPSDHLKSGGDTKRECHSRWR